MGPSAAREKVARGRTRTLLAMLFRPPARFLRMYVLRLGFLDGRAGFVLAAMAAWYVFLKYAKVWEATAVAGRRGDAGERPGG